MFPYRQWNSGVRWGGTHRQMWMKDYILVLDLEAEFKSVDYIIRLYSTHKAYRYYFVCIKYPKRCNHLLKKNIKNLKTWTTSLLNVEVFENWEMDFPGSTDVVCRASSKLLFLCLKNKYIKHWRWSGYITPVSGKPSWVNQCFLCCNKRCYCRTEEDCGKH